MTLYLYRILNPIFFQCNAWCQIFLKLAQRFWRTKWKYANILHQWQRRRQSSATDTYLSEKLTEIYHCQTINEADALPTGEKGRYFEKDISTENKPIYCRNELRSLSTFYTIGIKLKLEWAKGRENMLQTKL